MNSSEKKTTGIVDNLKKATVELLILGLLSKEDMHTFSLLESLEKFSQGLCKITFPYAAIYRLQDNNYIYECGKKVDSNRRRQYFRITPEGREYFSRLRAEFNAYINGVNMVLDSVSTEESENAD